MISSIVYWQDTQPGNNTLIKHKSPGKFSGRTLQNPQAHMNSALKTKAEADPVQNQKPNPFQILIF